MTLSEHQAKLNRAATELVGTQLEDALLTTLDIIGLVKLRLASEGKRADGSDFSDYNPIYARQRDKKGLQTSMKDFNVTGRLYASIQPEVLSTQPGNVQVGIVPRGGDNEVKVAGQTKREGGNILQPSPDEIREATLAHSKRRIDRALALIK